MKKGILLLFFISSYVSIVGQTLNPVKWTFDKETDENGKISLVFHAEIQEGWTVYSQFTGDDGPVPTEITYEENNGVTIDGKNIESGHKKEGYDKMFDTNVIKFLGDKPYVIKQAISLPNGKGELTGYLTYMACDNERCLPPTDVDFSFSLASANEAPKQEDLPEKKKDKIVESENLDVDVKASNEENPVVIEETQQDLPSSQEVEVVEESITPIVIDMDSEGSALLDSTNDEEQSSGMEKPVTWTMDKKEDGNGEFTLQFKADIKEGWTVYSQFTGDGPVPTSIEYLELDGAELVGESIESGHRKEGYDKVFDTNVIKFFADKPYQISQKIKMIGDEGRVEGYLTYMACDSEKCLPPTDVDFEFLLGKAIASGAGDPGNVHAAIDGNSINQKIPSIVESLENPIGKCDGPKEEKSGFLWTFIFGFLGGLFALLTPCVFPMIPITVSFFTKDTKRSGLTNGLIYGASIIFIYVTLGLLITILVGPDALNRLSTNWIANSLFFIIFVAFAFSFFGYYELQLPSSWMNKSDKMADKGGLLGIFFMAFTLALVSFSCTGPIIGTAIVQAASKGEYIGPFITMLGFSVALALPFGLFAAFPAWLNSLPKSGSWMTSVKVFLGFLELALALKFLSVADMTNNWGFLKYEIFMGLWIVIFLGLAAYLFGFIKFPHDSPIKKLSIPRKAIGIGVLALVFYLGTGLTVRDDTKTYNALTLMSGVAPPANYNLFLPSAAVDEDIKSRYPSYTKCANNIDCFKDYYEGVAYAKEVNKLAMLDFTGHGCVNCRKTEEHIWVKENIRNKLNDDIVLISLYVDDDKKLDEVLLSSPRENKKLRNIGNKWSDFQIVNFNQNSQPLYVMITPDEEVVSLPRGYNSDAESYNDFLDCAINSFDAHINQ